MVVVLVFVYNYQNGNGGAADDFWLKWDDDEEAVLAELNNIHFAI